MLWFSIGFLHCISIKNTFHSVFLYYFLQSIETFTDSQNSGNPYGTLHCSCSLNCTVQYSVVSLCGFFFSIFTFLILILFNLTYVGCSLRNALQREEKRVGNDEKRPKQPWSCRLGHSWVFLFFSHVFYILNEIYSIFDILKLWRGLQKVITVKPLLTHTSRWKP